ncbi:MAG TPA: MIP/aquaporin family protein [Bryobacteraceae bacterium]|nr:MIP/aquaporin family protein [Bryobacteraceae bacterium]
MDSISAAVLGEFVGTAMLIFLGEGIVAGALLARSKAHNAGWIAITTAWGLAVLIGIVVAAALGDKDQHLNPAVTIASVLMTGHAERLWVYIPAQLAGAFFGALLVWIFYLPHWPVTQSGDDKLAVFCTSPAIRSPVSNFICELLGTFVLVLIATAVASKRIAPGGTPPGLGPILVGGLVWSIGLSLGGTTGYAINPARDFAPRLAHALLPIAGKRDSDWGYAWVPIAGPICGAVLAALFVNLTGMQ